jgi:hypothetical protein
MERKRRKTGGRRKGTPNKITKDLRKMITGFCENRFDEVMKAWESLDAKDRVKIYIDLLSFCLPKLQNVYELPEGEGSYTIKIEKPKTEVHTSGSVK